ncbi:GntR family transcriptional regulator [Nitratireductor sp. XY-223]|uniref:GntR family transcriptional regulator n=1 Tax=Nitratireductor sp. XY-223 TaxID=2561926 RepID=UPI0010AB09A2|nr:GntR family transcriptional regulator [Nitratireductor sp. XY-223]
MDKTGSGTSWANTEHDLYRAVRSAIVTLKFAPGQLISENELADRYQVSRTPVRAVLKSLEREGLVHVSSRRKTMVAPLDLSAYRQAVFARNVLETAAAGEAARLFKTGDERVLTRNVAEQEQARKGDDVAALDQLDFEFHREVFQVAALEHLIPIVDSLRGHTDRMRVAHLTALARYDRFQIVGQHASIADAIETADQQRAEASMSAHIVSVLSRVALLARERPDFFGNATDDEIARLEDYLANQSSLTRKEFNTFGKA